MLCWMMITKKRRRAAKHNFEGKKERTRKIIGNIVFLVFLNIKLPWAKKKRIKKKELSSQQSIHSNFCVCVSVWIELLCYDKFLFVSLYLVVYLTFQVANKHFERADYFLFIYTIFCFCFLLEIEFLSLSLFFSRDFSREIKLSDMMIMLMLISLIGCCCWNENEIRERTRRRRKKNINSISFKLCLKK